MAKKTPRAGRASKSRARKRAAVPKKAPNRRRAPARRREQTGANDPLFVPHPRALAKERLARFAAADPYAALLESICGATDDSQAGRAVRRHARRDGRIRRARISPRRVRCSGTITSRRSTRIPATSPACGGAAGR